VPTTNQTMALSRLFKESIRLFKFGLPIVIGQSAMIGIGLTNVFMAGQVSPEDLAGVTLGNSISTFVFLILGGILFANGPLIGHHHGAQDTQGLRRQFQQCFWLTIPLAILATMLMILSIQLMELLDATPKVIETAQGYLTPMAFTMFGYHLFLWIRTTLEAIGAPKVVMLVNIGGFVSNIFLSYGFVNGAFGLPELGGAGCGWASLIIINLQLLGFFWYTVNGRVTRKLKLFSQFLRPHFDSIVETLKLGLPIALSVLFEFGFFGAIPLLVVHLGASVVSAHSIAYSFDSLMFMIPFGVAQSITISISHRLGRKEPHLAKQSCWAGLGMICFISLLQVCLYVFFRYDIARTFSNDPQVIELAAELMLFAAGFRLMDAISVGAQGAMRGYKTTKFPMYVQFVAFWVIGFPLAYSLALTSFWGAPMGVSGFWMALVITLTLSSTVLTLMARRQSNKACELAAA
jgi:MATE family multidrug resistance protein